MASQPEIYTTATPVMQANPATPVGQFMQSQQPQTTFIPQTPLMQPSQSVQTAQTPTVYQGPSPQQSQQSMFAQPLYSGSSVAPHQSVQGRQTYPPGLFPGVVCAAKLNVEPFESNGTASEGGYQRVKLDSISGLMATVQACLTDDQGNETLGRKEFVPLENLAVFDASGSAVPIPPSVTQTVLQDPRQMQQTQLQQSQAHNNIGSQPNTPGRQQKPSYHGQPVAVAQPGTAYPTQLGTGYPTQVNMQQQQPQQQYQPGILVPGQQVPTVQSNQGYMQTPQQGIFSTTPRQVQAFPTMTSQLQQPQQPQQSQQPTQTQQQQPMQPGQQMQTVQPVQPVQPIQTMQSQQQQHPQQTYIPQMQQQLSAPADAFQRQMQAQLQQMQSLMQMLLQKTQSNESNGPSTSIPRSAPASGSG